MTIGQPPKTRQDLFAEWTPEESWLAGLIWADGCLHVVRDHQHHRSIVISSVDEDVIRLGADIAHVRYRRFIDRRPNRKPSFHIQLGGAPVVARLAALGLAPRKSLTAEFPRVNHLRHFIRGYFDGDGTVMLFRNPNTLPSSPKRLISGFEGSVPFLTRLQAVLSAECGIAPKALVRNRSIHRFRYNHADSLLLADFMYREPGPWMERKRTIFETGRESGPLRPRRTNGR